jgi:hypothetical protein
LEYQFVATSFQGYSITLTGQFLSSTGNFNGLLADTLGNSFKVWGWSAFAELKQPQGRFSLFGRYDYMKGQNSSEFATTTQSVVGVAYNLFRRNKIVVDYSRNTRNGQVGEIVEIMVELAF